MSNQCWASHPNMAMACQCGRDKDHDGVHACWCGERWTATNCGVCGDATSHGLICLTCGMGNV